MQITLAQAISQLRDDLRDAIFEGEGHDLVFTPQGIELELGIFFDTELQACGGVKVLVFLDRAAEATKTQSNSHKIKLSLSVSDKNGNPIRVRSNKAGF